MLTKPDGEDCIKQGPRQTSQCWTRNVIQKRDLKKLQKPRNFGADKPRTMDFVVLDILKALYRWVWIFLKILECDVYHPSIG